ncbi:translational activator of cytochrome c oxidase 1 [Leptinotarsa decemlineata]|uniref:translational activator of cytochrome c oxidase 1 n=1 Tax=Leptinotarsa decemlineata TaxID=7539 RepID=UPI000C25573B|nr:translational activator of cytochrome c oxidase 1 [Leptinotarsa decemlineata]
MFNSILKVIPTTNTLRGISIIKRFAGHSKWQNIRHIKGLKDAQKNQLFTKLGRQIKVAVQEGGSLDVKSNLKLSQVIDQAKRANMPSTTIQSILKSCQNDKSQMKSYLIEIKGPGSCFILCEVFTSNLHMLKQNMASILRRHQSKFSEGGTHLFEEKGVIEAECLTFEKMSEEEVLEQATNHAIESGAEDVKVIEKNIIEFTCGKSNLNKVVQELEKIGYKVTSAMVEYTPLKLQQLQETELDTCASLYDKLENLPDVVKLTDNIA